MSRRNPLGVSSNTACRAWQHTCSFPSQTTARVSPTFLWVFAFIYIHEALHLLLRVKVILGMADELLWISTRKGIAKYEDVSKSFRTESIRKYTPTTINTRWEVTQRVMATKLTRLTHTIATQLHLVAESCTICSSRSRRPVLELLDYRQ
jgi:hypothetical protein